MVDHLEQWGRGDAAPGRTVADLKTAGLADLLAGPGADRADLVEPWERWERGAADPAAVLAELTSAGVVAFLEGLAVAPAPGSPAQG